MKPEMLASADIEIASRHAALRVVIVLRGAAGDACRGRLDERLGRRLVGGSPAGVSDRLAAPLRRSTFMWSPVRQASSAKSSWLDAVVCEGVEAGGHNAARNDDRARRQVADAVWCVPVIAAGGIALMEVVWRLLASEQALFRSVPGSLSALRARSSGVSTGGDRRRRPRHRRFRL